jgi:hypothetical protein
MLTIAVLAAAGLIVLALAAFIGLAQRRQFGGGRSMTARLQTPPGHWRIVRTRN